MSVRVCAPTSMRVCAPARVCACVIFLAVAALLPPELVPSAITRLLLM